MSHLFGNRITPEPQQNCSVTHNACYIKHHMSHDMSQMSQFAGNQHMTQKVTIIHIMSQMSQFIE